MICRDHKDPTRYYPDEGVDDLNLVDYLDYCEEMRSEECLDDDYYYSEGE